MKRQNPASLWTTFRPHRWFRVVFWLTHIVICMLITYQAEKVVVSITSHVRYQSSVSYVAEAKRSKKKRKSKRSKRKASRKKIKKTKRAKKKKRARRQRNRRSVERRRARRERSNSSSQKRTRRRTGVKSLSRRDQRGASNAELERGARDRWQKSKDRVRSHARRRRSGRLRRSWNRRPYSYKRRRTRHTHVGVYINHPERVSAQPEGPPYEVHCDEQDTLDMCSPDRPFRDDEIGREMTDPEGQEPDEGIFVDLELSGGLWMYHIPKPSGEGWEGVTHIAEYQISPSPSYRTLINLSTPYGDLSASYQAREGVDFLGSGGSLLDFLIAVPWLDRWSLGYKRVRFEDGSVVLRDRGKLVERQAFSFEATEWRLSYQLPDVGMNGVQLWGRLHERGLPRQYYLADQPGEDETRSYFDVSDQLLWVNSRVVDFGFEFAGGSSSLAGWMWKFGLGIGGGSYELRTPLGGAGLDRGSLLSIPFYGNLGYRIPLSKSTGLKLNYHCSMLLLNPIGLPDHLEDELAAEEDISDLSLSFGSIDISQHLWLSVYVEL